MEQFNLTYTPQEFSKHLYIETYGCQMNVADSEVVASVMKMAGYDVPKTSTKPMQSSSTPARFATTPSKRFSRASTSCTRCNAAVANA